MEDTRLLTDTHTHTCPVYHTIPIIIPLPICQAQIEAVHLLLFAFIYLFSYNWNWWQCILLEQFTFYSELFYWLNGYQSAIFNSSKMQRCNGHMCRDGKITPLSEQLISLPAKIIPNWTYYLDSLKLFVPVITERDMQLHFQLLQCHRCRIKLLCILKKRVWVCNQWFLLDTFFQMPLF